MAGESGSSHRRWFRYRRAVCSVGLVWNEEGVWVLVQMCLGCRVSQCSTLRLRANLLFNHKLCSLLSKIFSVNDTSRHLNMNWSLPTNFKWARDLKILRKEVGQVIINMIGSKERLKYQEKLCFQWSPCEMYKWQAPLVARVGLTSNYQVSHRVSKNKRQKKHVWKNLPFVVQLFKVLYGLDWFDGLIILIIGPSKPTMIQ